MTKPPVGNWRWLVYWVVIDPFDKYFGVCAKATDFVGGLTYLDIEDEVVAYGPDQVRVW